MHTILVIDPDALALDGVVRALAEAGLDTLAAAEAHLGLELARLHGPDVVLCDDACRHPLLDALRDEPATASIPIILMSAAPDYASLRTGPYLGADDYLFKPFGIADLLAAVEAQVRRHQALRRRADARLDALRASISTALPHELKTPLSSILGGTQMMMLDAENMTTEEVKEIARLVFESGTRLRRLVENFLSYVQIEELGRDDGGALLRAPAYTALPYLVLERVARMHGYLRRRTADLVLDLGAADQPVAVAWIHLEKIADALLDNAFKFSEPGTPVHVAAHTAADGLHLRITDAGRGMDAQQTARFDAYVQFDRGRYEQQGAGLGLHLVTQLIGMHGGQLHVESMPDAGTTVEVILPRALPDLEDARLAEGTSSP